MPADSGPRRPPVAINPFAKNPLSSITLDHVLSGDTCDPISLADFESYLDRQEHTVENLQFITWFQSYRTRFFALPKDVQARCPGPTRREFDFGKLNLEERVEKSEKDYLAFVSSDHPPLPPVLASSFSSPTMVHQSVLSNTHNMPSPPLALSIPTQPSTLQSTMTNTPTLASPPFSPLTPATAVDLLLPPRQKGDDSFQSTAPSELPFRAECLAVMHTFIKPGASRELNLEQKVRDMIMKDLTWNTHPDIFLPAYEHIYNLVSSHSLPAFIRISTTNVNDPKARFWLYYGMCNFIVSISILLALILAVPVHHQVNGALKMGMWGGGREASRRAWRLFSVPNATLGGMQFYCFSKGFCSDVWGRNRTQLRPWELDDPETFYASVESSTNKNESSTRLVGMTSAAETESDDLEKGVHGEGAKVGNVAQADGDDGGDGTGESSKKIINPHTQIWIEEREGRGGIPAAHSSSSSSSSSSYPPPNSNLLPPPSTTTTTVPPSSSSNTSNVDRGYEMTKADKERKPRMFGPERIVLDPRIQAVHNKVMMDMLWVGLVWGTMWAVGVVSLPGMR